MNHIQIPYEDLKLVNKPYLDDLALISREVIENGWYVLGENVKAFEQNFGALHNNSNCIGVASGLDALILGLSVFNFPLNSKVLVPSNAYIASILAIIRSGLIPVLVEPDPLTYNINAECLEQMYDKDCVAILPVHMYGRISPMIEIMEFAKIKNLKVIEDCAQSHFAQIDNYKAGEFGDIGAFSFYPTKNLGALGDAGAIICKDEDIYQKIKALRNYGSEVKYHNKFIGWNSRLDELQAAFLLKKLPDFNKVISHKKELSDIYFQSLGDIEQIQLPANSRSESVWHIFNILVDKRSELKNFMHSKGIGTEIHYPIPPHYQDGYRNELFGRYPISEFIHNTTLSLPVSTCHSHSDINKVIDVIHDFFKQ